jgi:DNA-binding response OmpR family regulator
MTRPILIVEDDRNQLEILVEGLSTGNEFQVSSAESVSEADTLLGAEDARYDAVLLDLRMPDGDGHSYCAKLRRLGHKMPIIIVTGLSSEADVVRGFDAGANDYLTKPFSLIELLARLRAQLRIFDDSEDAVFTIGQYTFRPSAKLLQDPDRKRRWRLTDKETALLKFLYRAGGETVSRPVLLDKVWGYSLGAETHTLETHIYRLRQKIEANPAYGRILVTEVGGYRLDIAATVHRPTTAAADHRRVHQGIITTGPVRAVPIALS